MSLIEVKRRLITPSRRSLIRGAAAALFVPCAPAILRAQVPMTGGGKGTPGAAAVNNLAYDVGGGSYAAATGSGTSLVVTGLSTTASNCIIAICVASNFNLVSSVSSSNITWAGTGRVNDTGGGSAPIEIWYGVAASPLSSESITVNYGGSNGFMEAIAFGISGANTTTKFDSNGSLPGLGNGATPITGLSTTNAFDMIIAFVRGTGAAVPTWDGNNMTVLTGTFSRAAYLVVNATFSGVSCDWAASSLNGFVVDAVISS